MQENDFRIEVVQRLTKIETLLSERPPCQQSLILDKISNNRKALAFLFTLYLAIIGKLILGG